VRDLPSNDAAFDYAGYYRAENLAVPGFVRASIRRTLSRFERYRRLGRLFDVGFGAGAFLDEARAERWETAGVEASSPPVEQARRNGHDARLLQNIDGFAPASFDVVVATEVVEHVHEPLGVLDTSGKLLRSGGLLYLTTPAGDGLNGRVLGADWSTMAPPEHLALFSAQRLALLLARAGFRVVEMKTTGLNPFQLISSARGRVGSQRAEASPSAPGRAVNSSQLNELAMSNPVGSLAKGVVNSILGATGLGDTLKVFAEKL
jgi:2-polyprenyl-3-methyl-5-hydroxy-6-metoxy-1,4-benzoquinol methylase